MTIANDVDLTLWEPLPDVPNAASDFRGYALASVRDTLYLSGGIGDGSLRRSLMSYDVAARRWTSLPDMICFRRGHRLAVVEGGLYLFAIGGYAAESAVGCGDTSKRRTSVMKTSLGKSKAAVQGEMLQAKVVASYEVYNVSKKRWIIGGILGVPRRDFAISADPTCGKIYVFGGMGIAGALSSAEVYDPHVHCWRPLSPMPRSCQGGHAVHVGGLIHIFQSGLKSLTYDTAADSWSDHEPDRSCIPRCPLRGNTCSVATSWSEGQVIVYEYVVAEADGSLANRWMVVHVAKKRNKSWTVLPPADGFVYYKTAIANGKLVVAIGNAMLAFQVVDDAIDESSHAGESPNSTGSTFNESTLSGRSDGEFEPIKRGNWKQQPQLSIKPKDFRGYAVASVGNKVYISGGFSGSSTVHRSFLSYNMKTKKWKKLPSMTHHRLGHRMIVSENGGYIYVLGGGDGKTLRSLGIDIYDVKKKTWTSGPAMNSYRVFFGVIVCLGKLIVFGGVGSSNGNELCLVEFYDPETNCWKYAKNLPEARGVCNVIAIGHVIYLFGTPSQQVLAYDVIAGEWREDVSRDLLPEIPAGGCVCASSSYAGGEVLVLKYPVSGKSTKEQRRTAYIYSSQKKSWSYVHLLDDFACYSAVVASDSVVVVTPQNELMACALPK
ncbi:hypothetical protein ACHAWF_017091 [Thalassiosira exigua]